MWFPGSQYAARLVVKLATPPAYTTSFYVTENAVNRKAEDEDGYPSFDLQRFRELGCAEGLVLRKASMAHT